ncbi:scaffolding protein [Arthrobacter phage Lilmac1015]|uniref:Scaffolding protein n=1 Tax=Arthrobacter phage Lilmac1015 TaxID=2912653 RepID=A0AA49H152_9CAUD|nr:scaffolding protein [Arthrobacter phage Lilmac1015]
MTTQTRVPIARTTIKGVELLKAGDWKGLLGRALVTKQMLSDIVAAYNDPEVDRPVIKLGHIDPRFDGQPAAGWVTNPRLSEDGGTLIGDLADMPSRLAAIVPTAFRRRSVEYKKPLTTPSGKTYSAALSALALLGVQAPAVKGLEDILDVYASEAAEALDSEATFGEVVSLSIDDDTPPVPPKDPAAGDARTGSGTDPANESKGAPVAILEALKERLGLPADATEEQVEAALTAAKVEAASADGAGTPPAAPAAPAEGQAPAAPAAPAPTTNLSEGGPKVIQLSETVWGETTSRLAELEKESADRRRKETISVALSAGRISPAEVGQWEKALAESEAPTVALLASLPARYSTVEVGLSDGTPAPEADEAELERLAEEAGI